MAQPAITTRLRSWVLLAVLAFLVQHIARWGRPVQTRFVIQSQGSPSPHEWFIKRRSNDVETWRVLDVDGDGVMDEFETPVGKWERPTQPRRWLIVCLDGVPFVEMERLWSEGHFREFYHPVVLVSSFPSDSEIALTSALHAASVPGYEHRYFDLARSKVGGGVSETVTGKNIPYLHALDYDEPGIFKGLHFIVPRKSYHADAGRLLKSFRKSESKVFVAHVASTDALYHILKPEEVRPLLLELEDVVGDLYISARGDLGVLVFSDHGNTLTSSRAAPFEAMLKQRGWHLSDRLRGTRDVAAPAYGLIGFLAVYCRAEAVPQLARDLVTLEGTDLVIFRDSSGGGAQILGKDGQAYLRWSPDGLRYWYEADSGDPLDLLPAFARLRADGQVAEDGSASDVDLFQATAKAPYPDAAARIREWAINHVQNPASIAVSFKAGYFYGSGAFQHIVNIASTHGALDAFSSLGFAMATRPLPPALRLGDVISRGSSSRTN